MHNKQCRYTSGRLLAPDVSPENLGVFVGSDPRNSVTAPGLTKVSGGFWEDLRKTNVFCTQATTILERPRNQPQ